MNKQIGEYEMDDFNSEDGLITPPRTPNEGSNLQLGNNGQDPHTLSVLQSNSEFQRRKIQNLQESLLLYEEIIRHERSSKSRKTRMRRVMKEYKTDIRSMRDAMVAKVFPYLKFATKTQVSSGKVGNQCNTIMLQCLNLLSLPIHIDQIHSWNSQRDNE